jgi:GAF domain-containing protein
VEIPVGQGVCGTAVQEGANQNVRDVTKVESYLPCSPDVRSELVVLIRAGDDIFGELDLDSEQVGAFTEADEEAVQAVADKLAEQIVAERR